MLTKPAVMLLGLICEKPLNAYEIIKLLNTMNVKWWYNIADSTVYSTLKVLEKKGLIIGKAEKVGNMPDRTVYTITAKGDEELRSALSESVLSFTYDTNVFSIAAFFLGIFSSEEQFELLSRRLELLNKYHDGINRQLSLLKGTDTPSIHIANTKRMAGLVEAEIRGTRRLLEAAYQVLWQQQYNR